MGEGSHDIQIRVAVGDHHALRPCRRSARVVDGQEIGLGDFDFAEAGRMRPKRRFVIDPAVTRAFQRHEVFDASQSVANAVDGLDVVSVSAYDLRPAVVDDVLEVIWEQPIVDRHQYRADLRNRVICLQVGVRVRGDVGDSIALSDSEGLERRRPAVAAFQELCVGQPQISIDDRFALAVEPSCTPGELQGSQGNFHKAVFLQCVDGRGVSATSDTVSST